MSGGERPPTPSGASSWSARARCSDGGGVQFAGRAVRRLLQFAGAQPTPLDEPHQDVLGPLNVLAHETHCPRTVSAPQQRHEALMLRV